jgi:hypothetical protein
MPRDIFAEEEESKYTTHNGNGTHNAVYQQNGRSTNAANAAACSRHPNGNVNGPPPPNIIKIDAALKTEIEALLIKKTHEFDRDLINATINQVIGNRNSLLSAAMKLDRELAGGSPEDHRFPSITRLLSIVSWTSNSQHETGLENSKTQCCNRDGSCVSDLV